jgi:hypothetical protein
MNLGPLSLFLFIFPDFTAEPEAGLLKKSSCLAPALGVTQFMTVIDMDLAALCCATSVRLRCSMNPPLESQVSLLSSLIGLKQHGKV